MLYKININPTYYTLTVNSHIRMSVNKIALPADFGIENLDSPVHGNIQVNMQQGQKMRANSMILALQSPVFQSAFLDLEQTSVDVEDFSNEIVRVFLEALYCGRVTVSQENFRELYKMATVFGVEWLSRRCRVYFFGVLEPIRVTLQYDREGGVDINHLMAWAVEEAMYTKQVLKSSELLDATIEELSKLSNTKHVEGFIRHCLKDFEKVKQDNFDVVIEIAGTNYQILLEILKENLLNPEHQRFNENARYLLNKLNIVKQRPLFPKLCDEIFDILTEGIDKLDSADVKFVARLLREALKVTNQPTIQSRRSKEFKFCPSPDDTLTEPIANLFHDGTLLNNLIYKTKQLKNSVEISYWLDFIPYRVIGVENLYMLLELLSLYASPESLVEFSKENLEQLKILKSRHGWCPVHPNFLEGLQFWSAPKTYELLLSCDDLVSHTKSFRVQAEKSFFALKEFFSKETIHIFHYQNPKCPREGDGNCAFGIKVTPGTRQNPEQFDISLLPHGSAMLSADLANKIHFHDGLIRGSNIHLELEAFETDESMLPGVCSLSWSKKPKYYFDKVLKTHSWNWGKHLTDLTPKTSVRFVAYIERI